MQRKENDFQPLGICHRLFNFIMNSLIARGLKRITLGHPMPQGSTTRGAVDEDARSEVQEPLISHAKPKGEERVNSKLKDDLDSVVRIHFVQTEVLDEWTPIDKLGSSDDAAAKDDEAMEKRNRFTDLPAKEIPLLNGISVGTTKPKGKVRIRGEGPTGPKNVIPITGIAGHQDPRSKVGTAVQPDASTPRLTGLGLNINEISEAFIQNTKEKMSRNVSLMEHKET